MYGLCKCYGTDFLSLQKLAIYTLPKTINGTDKIQTRQGFFFTFIWPCIVTNFFIIRPTRITNFAKFIFGMKIYMFRTLPLSVIRSSFTIQSAMVYIIQVCRQLTSRTRMELQFHSGPARKLSTNLYDIYDCWVYSEWTPDDGQRHCPKHVDFHAKNKIAKWMYLVGLIIKRQRLYCPR